MKTTTKHLDNNTFRIGKNVWRVSRLIKLAEDLTVFKIPLNHLNVAKIHPHKIYSIKDYVDHIKRVNKAKLKYPIILDDQGRIMDGYHRVAKAILKNKKYVVVLRFNE